MRLGGILRGGDNTMNSSYALARAWIVIMVWVLTCLIDADSKLYRYVNIDEQCGLNTNENVDITAPAGEVKVTVQQTSIDAVNCSLTLTAPAGKRISVFFEGVFYFPVPDCSYGSLTLRDPVTKQHLTPSQGVCGLIQESQPKPEWMTLYYTAFNKLEFVLHAKSTTLMGSIVFTMKYTTFTDTGSNCFRCADVEEKHVSVCIDKKLICDNTRNCFDGSDEDFRYTSNKSCSFKCSKGNQTISSEDVCNGINTCADGSDEHDDVCVPRKAEPFSTLSTVDIVVSIICAVILVVLTIVCLYCYCCPPPPRRYRKAYKRAQKEARRARAAQASIDGQPARNAQQV